MNGSPTTLAPPLPAGRVRLLAVGVLLSLVLLTLAEIRLGPAPIAVVAAGIAVFAVLCATSLETAFVLVLAATPFSMQVVFPGVGSALQIPTEPMLFVALVAWAFRFAGRGTLAIAQPGLTLILALALTTCLLSFIGGSYLVLAMKATLNATWYGLLGIFIYNNFADRRRLRQLVLAWTLPGMALIAYSMANVLGGHYNRWAGYFWGEPFFIDHGTFSAYLSFVFALCVALMVELRGTAKAAFGAMALLSGGQVVLSLTRGAWLGLGVMLIYLVFVSGRRLLRPSNVALAVFGGVLLVGVLVLTGTIGDVEKHSGTITEVGYKSNFERINRWYSGWRMFLSSPITGVGYGTYPDHYGDFRRFVLSTDESDRRIGVHSEYLRVLAETGLLGSLTALAALILLARLATRAIRRAADPFLRALAVGMTGGLVTYLVHGIVNNYLEFDKAAVPVWMAIGILGAIDRLNEDRPVGPRDGA